MFGATVVCAVDLLIFGADCRLCRHKAAAFLCGAAATDPAPADNAENVSNDVIDTSGPWLQWLPGCLL